MQIQTVSFICILVVFFPSAFLCENFIWKQATPSKTKGMLWKLEEKKRRTKLGNNYESQAHWEAIQYMCERIWKTSDRGSCSFEAYIKFVTPAVLVEKFQSFKEILNWMQNNHILVREMELHLKRWLSVQRRFENYAKWNRKTMMRTQSSLHFHFSFLTTWATKIIGN